MASKFFEDVLSSEVDESAVNALVGSLESQLNSQSIQSTADKTQSVNSSHTTEANLNHDNSSMHRIPQKITLINHPDMSQLNTKVNQVGEVSSNSTLNTNVMVSGGVPASGFINQVSTINSTPTLITNTLLTGNNSSSIVKNPSLSNQPSQPRILVSQAKLPQNVQLQANPSSSESISLSDMDIKPNIIQVSNSSGVLSKPGTPQPQQMVVQNPNILQGVQILNMNSRNMSPGFGQKNIAPRVMIGNTQMRLPTGQLITARPGTPVQNALSFPAGLMRANTIYVKSDANGQFQILNIGGSSGLPGVATTNANTYRIQSGTPTPIRAIAPQPVTLASLPTNTQVKTTTNNTQPLTIQTSQASTDNAAAAPSQMSPNTAKKKCKNFLSTLILLAKDQPDHVASNVKNMVQGIIDGVIEPENFALQLHKELNSSPQPCLVPFLKKSLPYLRYSLMNKEVTIEGVKPPNPGSVPQPATPVPIQMTQGQTLVQSGNQLRLITPAGGTIGGALAAQLSSAPGLLAQQRLNNARPTKTLVTVPIVAKPPVVKQPATKLFQFRNENDDINEISMLSGMNILDDSQRLIAINQIQPRIRTNKNETFLKTIPLSKRINEMAKKHGLEQPAASIASYVSYAAQEYLKDYIEKLSIISEHRLENIRADPRFEIAQDVKCQLKFLEELDKMEKKRHEELEREVLLRAAKSRSKPEDPEQLKLKQKAKELQQAEMEEIRQRDANSTALLAIGPRKKIKLDSSVGLSQMGGLTNLNVAPKLNIRPRMKRVITKDMLFLMEQEKRFAKSKMLYKTYLK